jgi:hypothetical protein
MLAGVASAAFIIGLALVLAWKYCPKNADGSRPQQPKPRTVKRRKRR